MKSWKVAIVETNVGVKAWHARCLDCGWESKRKDREPQAVKLAKSHGAAHAQTQKGTK